MFIQLAYESRIDGKRHKAESIVETDYDTATNLINRGLARRADKPRKESKTQSNNEGDNEVNG